MDRQTAMELGGVVEDVIVIDWRDRDGCWTKYMRVHIQLDTSKPLRKVVCMVDSEGKKIICEIKYERLLSFCYVCGMIGHKTPKCEQYFQGMGDINFQYGN